MKKNDDDPVHKLGEFAWFIGTVLGAGVVLLYVGWPFASWLDQLARPVFGEAKEGSWGGALHIAFFLVVILNIAIIPSYLLLKVSYKMFFGNENDSKN